MGVNGRPIMKWLIVLLGLRERRNVSFTVSSQMVTRQRFRNRIGAISLSRLGMF